jgi:hypothetical protein
LVVQGSNFNDNQARYCASGFELRFSQISWGIRRIPYLLHAHIRR